MEVQVWAGRTSAGEVACTSQCLDLLVTLGHELQMILEPHEDEGSLSENNNYTEFTRGKLNLNGCVNVCMM